MASQSGGLGGPPPGDSNDKDIEMINCENTRNEVNNPSPNSQNNKLNDKNTNSSVQVESSFLYEDQDQGPYFIFLESTNTNKAGISRMHPMCLGQLLKKHFPDTEILSLSKNGVNRVKIQVQSREKANKIIKSNELKIENVKAYIPRFVLFRQGIIRNVDKSISEEDLLGEISPIYTRQAKVTSVRRFNRRTVENGTVTYLPTGTIQVTFRAQSIPTHVAIFYVRCEVEKFIPKVLQCTKCLRYGHTARLCKATERCSMCAGDHADKDCTTEQADRKCIHCKGAHSARANFKTNVCPEFDRQKRIKNLMVEENITFYEAKTKLATNYTAIMSRLQEIQEPTQASSTDCNTRTLSLPSQRPIRRLSSVRREIFSPSAPTRERKRARIQESPKQQRFAQEYQNVLSEYRYDQNQSPNGVCLNSKSKNNPKQKASKESLEFENVSKLSNFICTVIKNSLGLVGSSKKITPKELTDIIQKELSNGSIKHKEVADVTTDIFSSEDDE